MADTKQIKEPRLRLKRSAIEEAVAKGRMSRSRADELLADDGVPEDPRVGIELYPSAHPGDRTAPKTIALVRHVDGRRCRIWIRRDADRWTVLEDEREAMTGEYFVPGVVGDWARAVRFALARAFAIAEGWSYGRE